mmetsp:Transcript_11745/g.33056  ORF Transcript_11745/g.33056 Transcript_11745/m.33056 type:complete len:514 (-) Transcript_11745:4664-6205(-)
MRRPVRRRHGVRDLVSRIPARHEQGQFLGQLPATALHLLHALRKVRRRWREYGGVKREGDVDRGRRYRARQATHGLLHRVLRASEHHGPWCVYHGDRHVVVPFHRLRRVVPGAPQGHHHALRRVGAQREDAVRQEAQAGLKRHELRRHGRSELANAVTQYVLGAQAGLLGAAVEGHLQDVQGHLRLKGVPAVHFPEEIGPGRQTKLLDEQALRPVDHFSHRRTVPVRLVPHTRVLSPLASKQYGRVPPALVRRVGPHRTHHAALLQEDVRVGTAVPKGADTRDVLAPRAGGEGGLPVGQNHREAVQLDHRVEVCQMQIPRRRAALQHADGLRDAEHSRRRLEVAKVALGRPDDQRLLFGAVRSPVHRPQGPPLNGVPQGGTRAVGFNVAHVLWPEAGVRQGGPDDRLLGGPARRRERGRPAVLVERRALEHRVGRFPARQTRALLKEDGSAAFAPQEPVRVLVKGLARSVDGQHACLAEGHEHVRAQQCVNACHERSLAATPADGLLGEAQRD